MAKKRPKPRGGRREGAGRPKIMDQAAGFGLFLDATMLAALDSLAARRGQTRSEAIREAVGEWVERTTSELAECREAD